MNPSSSPQAPCLSIVLATRNRAVLLEQMLTSLKRSADNIPYEVVVLEGNSSDRTLEVLQKFNIRRVFNQRSVFGEGQVSWPRLYNFGFAQSAGRYAMYASDDILFESGCLENALDFLENQGSEVAGGMFFYKNLVDDHSLWRLYGCDYTYGQNLFINYGLIKRSAFEQVGGFDESYQFYCADEDLCLKMISRGWQLRPIPSSRVKHNNILDRAKASNTELADKDIQRYQERWKYQYSINIPEPRRLLLSEVQSSSLARTASLTSKAEVQRFSSACIRTLSRTEAQKPNPSSTGKNCQALPSSAKFISREKPILPEAGDAREFLVKHHIIDPAQALRLHLGCGEQHLDGYLNIDFPQEGHNVMRVGADVYGNILKLNFPTESVDEIRLHHVFEHFNRVTALALLLRWHQWLKVGGRLHIETPDLMGSARTLVSAASWTTKMGVVRHLAGDQAASWAYHIDHWFPERYERTLRAFGFMIVRLQSQSWPQEPCLSNVVVIAEKPAQVSMQEQLKAADALLWESTVSPSERPTHEVWKQQLREVLAGQLQPLPSNARTPRMEPVSEAARILSHGASQLPIEEIYNFNQRSRDRWVQAKAKSIPAGSLVLDVGAGTCPYKSLFSHCVYKTHDFKKYAGVKLGGTDQYGNIDYVSEITNIPAPDRTFDAILCTEVLEHVPEPIEALREMSRILKPGGRMLLTAPLSSGLHQLPFHFYGGYTPEWYKHFLPKFDLQAVEIAPNGGFFRLLAQESARFVWTMDQHQHLHGDNLEFLRRLFGDWLPRFLFGLEERCFLDQFSVGYHVEATKIAKLDQLQRAIDQNPADIRLYLQAAQALLTQGDVDAARKYLEDAEELDGQNPELARLQETCPCPL